MSNAYDVGDAIRLSVAFTNSASAAVDPSAVSLKVRNPAGTVTTYTYALGELTKASTGNYYRDIDLDAAGEWAYRFAGTTSNKAAVEGEFIVRPSAFD